MLRSGRGGWCTSPEALSSHRLSDWPSLQLFCAKRPWSASFALKRASWHGAQSGYQSHLLPKTPFYRCLSCWEKNNCCQGCSFFLDPSKCFSWNARSACWHVPQTSTENCYSSWQKLKTPREPLILATSVSQSRAAYPTCAHQRCMSTLSTLVYSQFLHRPQIWSVLSQQMNFGGYHCLRSRWSHLIVCLMLLVSHCPRWVRIAPLVALLFNRCWLTKTLL